MKHHVLPSTAGGVAQFVERQMGMVLRQVWSPGAARNFPLRVNFQCRDSYSVRTPLCATACINICTHVTEPVFHVRV